jgi:tetratricopeptide (TPR) repeat protein
VRWPLRVTPLLLWLFFFALGTPAGATCEASAYTTTAQDREGALLEAGSLSSAGHWADARAAYISVLARYRDDPEALFGLARLDSWGGCYSLAEDEYLRILGSHPEDADVRAGYVDLLLWDGRIDDAARVLARGLALDPGSAELLERAGRIAYWSGNATDAVRLADAAERAAPDDGDLREERDRLFLREVRATGRIDHYPPGYQDLITMSVQGLDRVGRFDLYAGAELVERTGAGAPTIVDAHYPVGIAYHPSTGVTLGAEVEPALPKPQAIAALALKVWAQAPVTHKIDAQLSYQLWDFLQGPEMVHIFNPALGMALPHELRVEARAWISVAHLSGNGTLPSQVSVAGAGGGLVSWHAQSRLDLGLTFTYGAELDSNPTLVQLLQYQSAVVSAYADRLINRHGGLRLTLGIDRRKAPNDVVIWIPAAELSAYLRW